MRKSNHFRDLTDMNEPPHYNHHITPPRQNQRLSDQIALLSDERIFLPVKWKNVHKIIVFIFFGLSYPLWGCGLKRDVTNVKKAITKYFLSWAEPQNFSVALFLPTTILYSSSLNRSTAFSL